LIRFPVVYFLKFLLECPRLCRERRIVHPWQGYNQICKEVGIKSGRNLEMA
jgi:hypothetical protein